MEQGRLTRQIASHAGVQVNNIFGAVSVTREIRSGYSTVRGDGTHGIIACGSVIDNLSQDLCPRPVGRRLRVHPR